MIHNSDAQTGTDEVIPESEPLWLIDADAIKHSSDTNGSAPGTTLSEVTGEKLRHFLSVTRRVRAALSEDSLLRSYKDRDERNVELVRVVFELLGQLELAFESITGKGQIVAVLKTLARKEGFFKCTHSTRDQSLDVVNEPDIPIEGSLSGDVLRHGVPVLISSLADPRVRGKHEESSLRAGRGFFNSGIFVPVVANGTVVGVLAVESPAKAVFVEEHVALVAHGADAIGLIFQVAIFVEALESGQPTISGQATSPGSAPLRIVEFTRRFALRSTA